MFYLMLGYPGSGKTTASKFIHELTGAEHMWADQERRKRFDSPTHSHDENIILYDALNHKAQTLLEEGKSVIFDTNFSFYKDRQLMREIAAQTNSKAVLLWVRTPKELAKQRATQNAHQQGTRILGDMPANEFERMSNNIQEPRQDEPYIELDGTKLSKEYVAEKLGL